MRRRAFVFAAAGLVPVCALLLAAFSCRGRIEIGEDWTPEDLYRAMRKAGMDWQAGPAFGGLILRRPGDTTPFEDLAKLQADSPRQFAAQRGRLYVTRSTVPGTLSGVRGMNPTAIQLGPLTVLGHPDELRESLGRFAP